jgi:transcription initiation factor TFIIIB Brf1 subunit/transcription initiation factor TFIIB
LIVAKTIVTMNENCEGCGAVKSMFEIHGDWTCVKCGVVTMTGMIDDTIREMSYRDNDRDIEMISIKTRREVKPLKVQKWCENDVTDKIINRYRDILVNKMFLDDIFAETCCEWFKKVKQTKFSCKQKRIDNDIFVCCAYCVSIYLKRGIDITRFCIYFNTKKKIAMGILPEVYEKWKAEKWYKEVSDELKTNKKGGVDKLRRSVYELSLIENSKHWNIIKNAEKILSKVKQSTKLQKVRTKSLNATCIYIACKIEMIKVKKEVFCRETDISIPTLNTTEALIQGALKKC